MDIDMRDILNKYLKMLKEDVKEGYIPNEYDCESLLDLTGKDVYDYDSYYQGRIDAFDTILFLLKDKSLQQWFKEQLSKIEFEQELDIELEI